MLTRLSVLLAMVVVLALGIGLLGVVSASPNDDHHNSDKERSSLTVLTKPRE
jgi:hypothetical protein